MKRLLPSLSVRMFHRAIKGGPHRALFCHPIFWSLITFWLIGIISSRAETLSGTPGSAEKSAVVNFSELASSEQLQARQSVERASFPPFMSPGADFWKSHGDNAEAFSSPAGTMHTAAANTAAAAAASPAPLTNFFAAGDTGFIPPDTMGAVGPNHLMVTLNGTVRIQSRNGSVISSMTLDQFWSRLGPFSSFTFDPKVFYDSFADRWIFVTPVDGELPSSAVLIAVSQGPDPTRNWNMYRFTADSTGAAWADYPSVGFNSKWIVASFNMFFTSGGYKEAKTWVFDKADLYANGTGRFNTFSDASGFTQTPVVSFDPTEPILYVVEDFDERSLRISTITGPVGQERFNIGTASVVAPISWSISGDNIAPQKGSSALIENNDARIINAVFRDGTIWTTHTVFFPAGNNPTRSAVQWWQINPNGRIIQRALIEDKTGNKFFAFPSIAVNMFGDALVGFSRFGRDQYAGANYALRLAGDPPNTMQMDYEFKSGEAPYFKDYGSGRNRWGDYSATVVDPLNDMDMWTIQEYAAAPTGSVSHWGTWWAMVLLSQPPDNILEIAVDPPAESTIIAGSSTNVFVRVTDVFAVTNATVSASIPGLPDVQFTNNGLPPDLTAADDIYSGSLFIPTNYSTVNMTLFVTAPGKQDFTTNIVYHAFPVPPNDMFSNAIKIPPQGAFGANIIQTANNFATTETGEPNHAGVNTREASLWWNYSTPSDSQILVDTSGSGIDTVVAVYTGSRVDQLTEVASVDDVGTRAQGFLTFTARAGITYRIVVAGKDISQQGPIRLRLEPNGQPDLLSPRLTVTAPPSGIFVQSDSIEVRGTALDPEPNASGLRLVRVQNLSAEPPVSYVADGTTNWFVTVQLLLGTNMLEAFSVDFAGNRSDAKVITVYYNQVLVPNDLFGNASTLSGNSGSVIATNTVATKEFGEPAHAGNEGGKSVWWKFTPPADGLLLLSTEGSVISGGTAPLDTLLGLYTGDFVTSLTEVASNDDASPGSGYSELTASLKGGVTYHIAVDGYAGAGGVIKLSYTFEPSTVFTVTATSAGGGSVSPASGTFPKNSTVTFTATPDPNFEFESFTTTNGDILSTRNPFSISLTGPTNIVAHFHPHRFTESFESGDFSRLPWQVSGWKVQSDVVAQGQFAAASTTHERNGTNSLVLLTQMLPGIGSFDFRVSTETNYDQLQFFVNDELRDSWSGEIPWTLYTFDVPGGLTRLEWRYVKDNAINEGLDTVYLDNVDIPLARPVLSINGSRQIQFIGVPNATYAIQASSDLKTWTTVATRTADQSGKVTFTEPLQPGQSARFYRVVAQ